MEVTLTHSNHSECVLPCIRIEGSRCYVVSVDDVQYKESQHYRDCWDLRPPRSVSGSINSEEIFLAVCVSVREFEQSL
jgi:hypothetical protein